MAVDLFDLEEKDIQPYFSTQSLRRARDYYLSGRVRQPRRVGNTLSARVQGMMAYEVEIEVEEGVISADCTCSYDWGGFCKHIGAVLLLWIRNRNRFELSEQPALPVLEILPPPPPPDILPTPSWLIEEHEDREESEREKLKELLLGKTIKEMREIAQRRGWRIRATSKEEFASVLASVLSDPTRIAGVLAGLPPEQLAALHYLSIVDDGQGIVFARLSFHDGEVASGISGPLSELTKSGLVFLSTDSRGRVTYFLLRSIAAALPPRPLPSREQPPEGHPLPARPLALLRTIHSLWQQMAVGQFKLRPLQPPSRRLERLGFLGNWDYLPAELDRPGLLRREDLPDGLTVPFPRYALADDALRALAPQVDGDRAKLDLLYHLMLHLGLIKPGSPVQVRQDVMTAFLMRGEANSAALLVRAYFTLPTWSELGLALLCREDLALKRNATALNLKPARLYEELFAARRKVLRLLASLPDGEWIELPYIYDLLRPIWPEFGVAHLPFGISPQVAGRLNWWLAEKQSGKAITGPESWGWVQGAFARALIEGPLYWLGLADLLVHGDDLRACRLRGLSGLLWERPGATYPDAEQDASSSEPVTGDGDPLSIAVRPDAIGLEAHQFLDNIACLKQTGPRLFLYRLDKKATYQAFEHGFTLSRIQAEWQDKMGLPMPAPIGEQLERWWRSYGEVRIYENLTVVEFADDFTLRELKAGTDIEKYIIYEASPRLVVIPVEAQKSLLSELTGKGYTPRQEESDGGQ